MSVGVNAARCHAVMIMAAGGAAGLLPQVPYLKGQRTVPEVILPMPRRRLHDASLRQHADLERRVFDHALIIIDYQHPTFGALPNDRNVCVRPLRPPLFDNFRIGSSVLGAIS